MASRAWYSDWDPERFRDYLCVLARQGLHAMMFDAVDESDVVQEVLLQAHSSRGGFRGTSEQELLAWLRKILTRKLLDLYRFAKRRKRDVARQRSLESVLQTSSEQLAYSLASAGSSPSQRAVRNEDLLRVSAAVQKLPEKQRSAIELHYLQGCTFSQVAAQMGLNRNQVAGLIRRGLSSLRKSLGTCSNG